MGVSRRDFLTWLGAGAATAALPGCKCPLCNCGPDAKIAVQLYSLNKYLGVNGFAKTIADVAAIGYTGVELCSGYGGSDPKEIRRILDDNGVTCCGIHVGRDAFGPEKVAKTCEFNLAIGNNLIICPGGGNFPPNPKEGEKPVALEDWMKMLVDFYNEAAENAAKYGCKVGLHNHTGEFNLKLKDGTTYWDYFFSNTDARVCMEQDVGWTTCAGYDPKEQYRKYPHRSPTLHAKENGMGKGVEKFDAILGRPGCDKDGKPCATPVGWDGLIPVSEADGVKWYVVECERHFDDLSAVTPSYAFLKSKGLN